MWSGYIKLRRIFQCDIHLKDSLSSVSYIIVVDPTQNVIILSWTIKWSLVLCCVYQGISTPVWIMIQLQIFWNITLRLWTSDSRYCEVLYCLRNAGNYSPKHAAARNKWLACLVPPLWEPQILHVLCYWLNECTSINHHFLCGIIRLIECELASKWIYQYEFYWLLIEYTNLNHALDCIRMPVCVVVVIVWIYHCQLHHVTKSDNINFIN